MMAVNMKASQFCSAYVGEFIFAGGLIKIAGLGGEPNPVFVLFTFLALLAQRSIVS